MINARTSKVVVRSILWGTVISVVLEAVCVGVILGVQTR